MCNFIQNGEEHVGIIAPTAIGEPLTSMNLCSFHRKIIKNKKIPKLKKVFSYDIINCAFNFNTKFDKETRATPQTKPSATPNIIDVINK